ncbi:MAG: ROK family glucokinase [Propionibacteriales bacterium]|nr:ROK family glucokinase [Propionibacteriales bacterium]
MSLTVGVDIGGTKIAAGVVDEAGRVLEEVRRETPATDPEGVEDRIADAIAGLRERHDVEAVGVGAAGFVDASRSHVLFAPNVAWRDEPLKSDLEKRIGLPVVVENDANAAAWGEFRFGAGVDVDDLLALTVGTGVGGGLVLDGALYRGGFGVAAEVGHMRVVPGGHICGCGNRGCWEQYAAGSALVREAREVAVAGSPMAAALVERAGGNPLDITGPMVTSAARDGDAFAQELLAQVGRWLGEGIAILAAILDPVMVAVGGGTSEAGDLLLDPTREVFRSGLTGRRYRPELEIRRAQLGGAAGMIGAADLARR